LSQSASPMFPFDCEESNLLGTIQNPYWGTFMCLEVAFVVF
jgi:hypothetical protein